MPCTDLKAGGGLVRAAALMLRVFFPSFGLLTFLMKRDEQGKAKAEDDHRNDEVSISQHGLCLIESDHSLLCPSNVESALRRPRFYLRELMSITNRYFTSCFNMRSKASLICWI